MTDFSFTVRNYRPADFDGYVRLHVETERLNSAGGYVSTRCLKEYLGRPNFDPRQDLFVAEMQGNIIGHVSVGLEPGIRRALLDCLVHPQHRRKGVASQLFACALQRAGEAGMNVVQVSIPQTNLAAKRLMHRLGFRFIRRFLKMELNLYDKQLPPVKPSPFAVRRLQRGEEDQLTTLQNRSFAGTWGFNPNTTEEIVYRLNSICCSPEDVIMIYAEDTPVAYCWTRHDPEANAARGENKGEIHMLGVDPAHRNAGIGTNVLLAGLSHLKRRGISLVELTADSEEPAALALYESVGFERDLTIEWFEKKLR